MIKSRRFLSLLLSAAFCFVFALPAAAETPRLAGNYATETEWPGIRFQVIYLKRILQNRLLVVVEIQATNKAPTAGVLLGGPMLPIPQHFKPTEADAARYGPQLFSLASSTMTDEHSGVRYPALPSINPPGKAYFSSATMASILPGQSKLLSIQFAVPPPPPPPPAGQEPVPQTLSFFLPKATGPILHVPLPPAEGPKAP